MRVKKRGRCELFIRHQIATIVSPHQQHREAHATTLFISTASLPPALGLLTSMGSYPFICAAFGPVSWAASSFLTTLNRKVKMPKRILRWSPLLLLVIFFSYYKGLQTQHELLSSTQEETTMNMPVIFSRDHIKQGTSKNAQDDKNERMTTARQGTSSKVGKNTWVLSNDSKKSPVVMATYVFGEEASQLKRFQMFVASTKQSGFDFVIVGDHKPPFELPDNVRHYQITWEELADRVFQKIFHDENKTMPKRADLKDAQPYKVCDFKPLMGYLFPEIVQGYEWWGHCDNDMVMGNLTKFFPKTFLDNYDIISGNSRDTKQINKAWGPFQLYRNIPLVNGLWKLLPPNLISRFAQKRYFYFDEWGQAYNKREESMSGLIEQHAQSLGLRATVATNVPHLLDKYCQKRGTLAKEEVAPRCAECVYRHGTLTKEETQEVAFCHYQNSKNFHQESSLEDSAKLNYLVRKDEFRVAFAEGFDYLEPPKSISR